MQLRSLDPNFFIFRAFYPRSIHPKDHAIKRTVQKCMYLVLISQAVKSSVHLSERMGSILDGGIQKTSTKSKHLNNQTPRPICDTFFRVF